MLVSCTVTRTPEDTFPGLSEDKQGNQRSDNPAKKSPGEKSKSLHQSELTHPALLNVLVQLQKIEESFSRGDCSDVAKRTLALQGLLSAELQAELPLSTSVALAECAARNQPDQKEQAQRALQHLKEAATKLTPPWDLARILASQAERLEKMGRPAEAIQIRQALAEQLQKSADMEKRNALALQGLDPHFAELSTTERNKLNELLLASYGDSSLFETLTQIDSASSQASQGFQILARSIRERTLLRIERLYAEDMAQLIAALQNGQGQEAKAISEKIKRRFPTVNYTRRTDATLASFANEQALALPGSSQQQEDRPLNTADMTLQQRVAQARLALAEGRPDQSVQYLRTIPESSRNPAISQLLSEAEDAHIRELRLRVRDLFKRAESGVSGDSRKADYMQSLEILRFIIKEYPTHSTRKQIDKNIRNIEALIQEARK